MQLTWIKCEGGGWCSLNDVNLDHSHFDNLGGVYVIWYNGGGGAWVRVGQGEIRDRLRAHRSDPEVQAYSSRGRLYVTWAAVGAVDRNGVEAYLAQRLNPLVGTRFPAATPIPVNTPGA